MFSFSFSFNFEFILWPHTTSHFQYVGSVLSIRKWKTRFRSQCGKIKTFHFNIFVAFSHPKHSTLLIGKWKTVDTHLLLLLKMALTFYSCLVSMVRFTIHKIESPIKSLWIFRTTSFLPFRLSRKWFSPHRLPFKELECAICNSFKQPRVYMAKVVSSEWIQPKVKQQQRKEWENKPKVWKVRQKHAYSKNCLTLWASPKVIWWQKKSFQTVVLVEFDTILVRFYQPNVETSSHFVQWKVDFFCFLFPIFCLPSAFMVNAGMVDSFTVLLVPIPLMKQFLFTRIAQKTTIVCRSAVVATEREKNNFDVNVFTMLWNEFKMRNILSNIFFLSILLIFDAVYRLPSVYDVDFFFLFFLFLELWNVCRTKSSRIVS